MTYRSLYALFGLLALAACSGNSVKETLGLERQAPDEFRVVPRPPLSVPPQFTLRAPSTSEESPGVVPANKQAESVVLGTQKPDANTGDTFSLKESNSQTAVVPVTSAPISGDKISTPGDSQFLKNIGADHADPKVRDQLAEQKIRKELEDPSWWDKFSVTPEKKDALVDAKKEAERIKTNKDTGKPVTEGQTPEVKEKDTGVLGRILGN